MTKNKVLFKKYFKVKYCSKKSKPSSLDIINIYLNFYSENFRNCLSIEINFKETNINDHGHLKENYIKKNRTYILIIYL